MHPLTKASASWPSQPVGLQTSSIPTQLGLIAVAVLAIGLLYGGMLWMSSAPLLANGAGTQKAPTPSVITPAPMAATLAGGALTAAGVGRHDTTRFVLSGVVATMPGGGVALIAVDGEVAKPYSVGTELAPGYVLQSITGDQVTLTETSQASVSTVLTMTGKEPGMQTNAGAPVSRPQVSGAMVDAKPWSLTVAPGVPAGPAARQDSRYQPVVIRRH